MKGNKKKGWIYTTWRPLMAFQYLIVCFWDFLVMPVLTMAYYAYIGQGAHYEAWDPITLNGSGFYHISMGAIIGVSAWSRGKEKIAYWRQDRIAAARRRQENSGDDPESDGPDADEDDAPEKEHK